jgi:hypothetical protein
VTDPAQARVNESAADLLSALDWKYSVTPLPLYVRLAAEKLRRALAIAAAADAERERFAA